ncbi:MAG: MBL fold metallo-hydrolase [Thermoplasmata archaeon]
MKLTVLGSSGAWPAAGRACSCYLLESAGERLVLDLGFGSLPRLLEQCPASDVRAVFVTHAHADHCVDLFGLFRARTMPQPRFPPLPVYALPEVMDRVGSLDGPKGPHRLKQECEFHPISADQSVDLEPFRIRIVELPHFVPNLGFRVEADDVVIAYTGDTGPSPKITELAHGADLFVCEATHQQAPPEGQDRFLLTATEAGRYAREAGVTQLMLTHFWPGDDREVSRSLAAREFAGKITIAEESLSLTLS